MNSSATRILLSLIAVLLTIGLTLARRIDVLDPNQQNELELVRDDLPQENDLFKYILANEILTRQLNHDQQNQNPQQTEKAKKNHYKPCAFNAITCFGKK